MSPDRPPGRPPDDDGPRQAIQPAQGRNHVKAPPGTTDTASLTRSGDTRRDLAGCAELDSQQCQVTLPYAQVPAERRTIGDATSRLDGHNGVLGVALAIWMARDDTRAQPEVRQAANTAMDSIDAMLAELHQLRARLLSEVHASDRAAAARADALLARLYGQEVNR